MKKITVVYKVFDKIKQEDLISERQGWQINSRLIMELDSEGPFFAMYSYDITSDTILASAATATCAMTIPGDIGKSLACLDGSEVASMTIADIGLIFAELNLNERLY